MADIIKFILYLVVFVLMDLGIYLFNRNRVSINTTAKRGFAFVYAVMFALHCGLLPSLNLLSFVYFLLCSLLVIFLYFTMIIADRYIRKISTDDNYTDYGKTRMKTVISLVIYIVVPLNVLVSQIIMLASYFL